LIIGLVLGVGAVGPFALADRLKQAIGGVLGPLTNAVYPLVCRISGRDASKEETRAKQLFFCLIVAVSGTASLGLLIFAPLIVSIVGGKAFEETTTLLRIIAPVPLIVALSNILGVQTMMPLRMDRQVAIIVTTAAIFGSAGMFISTYYFHLSGAAATVLLVEAFVTTAMAVALLRQRVSIIKLFWG
jgi:O-antigen/teichoic acid export membrane protein